MILALPPTSDPGTPIPPPGPATHAGRGRLVLMVLGLSLFFGALEAWQGRLLFPAVPAAKFWPEALASTLPSWLILAALMPGVIALSRAMRLDGHRRSLALPAHALGGIVFVMVHLGGAALVAALRHAGPSAFLPTLRGFLYRYMVVDFFVYGAIVGLLHVIWHQSELRRREVAESELRTRLAEARLGALRSQLNPHFLFNTLNAMSTLAMRGDRERLVGAIDALCALLRVALDERHGSWIPVAEEMQFVDRYLEIQALRFGERLAVEREVPAELAHALIPSLLLQPLVENAVEHGVAGRPGAGRIAIRFAREDLVMRIEISDSGPGFGGGAAAPHHHGLGLSNTRARLDQLFGGRASLDCANGAAGGARVTVRLPWIEPGAGSAPARAGAAT